MKPERVFVDTNLFLHYLTNDIPAQADAVEHLLRQAAAGDVLLVVNPFVLAEIIWTLRTYYKLTQDEITEKILAILNTPGMEVADRDLVLQAVTWWHDHNVDFIDAYNAIGFCNACGVSCKFCWNGCQ